MINSQFELQRDVEPLDGQLYMQQSVHDLMDIEYIRSLRNMLCFGPVEQLPIVNAAGRNYHVPLPKPVGIYDCVQVAGGGNYDLGIRSNAEAPNGIMVVPRSEGRQIIEPPLKDLFTSYTSYYENGALTEKTNINPVGAYSAQSATRKIANTLEAKRLLQVAGNEVLTPIYAGRFEYDTLDQNGENQTAMLMLVPAMGERFESTLSAPIAQLFGDQATPDDFEQLLDTYYQRVLGSKFQKIGHALGVLHSAGVNHNQPTPGNMAIFDFMNGSSLSYVTDWDTMTIPAAEDAKMARALDMNVALVTNASVPRLAYERGAIGEDAVIKALGFTACHILIGYLGQMGQTDLPRIRIDDVLDVMEQKGSGNSRLERVAQWMTIAA